MSARQYIPIPPAGMHGRLRVSRRKLDPTLSTDFLPIQSFDEQQRLHGGEIVAVEIAIMPAEIFLASLMIAGHEFLAPPATEVNTGVLAFMGLMPPLPTKNAGSISSTEEAITSPSCKFQ
jgi:hypothetical protein